jgi:hypothetical protein
MMKLRLALLYETLLKPPFFVCPASATGLSCKMMSPVLLLAILSLRIFSNKSLTKTCSQQPSKLCFFQPANAVSEAIQDHSYCESLIFGRRRFMSLATFPLILSGASLNASAEDTMTVPSTKKPFAPIETLLPAVRLKFTIDRATQLTETLLKRSTDVETIQQLGRLLLRPQSYTRSLKLQGVPGKPADLYLNSYKPMKGDLPLQRIIIKNGDVQTWKQLKKSEKEKENNSEIRAALNAYTDALSFSSDSYLLNVDKAARSSMVREDRLPDVKQVITSDMGMRYLYRNQVLTAMDDVKAEMEYQLGSPSKEWTDLLDLLEVAEKAMHRWFSLIDANDVQEAFDHVANEETLRQK